MADPAERPDPSTNATTHGLTARRPLCEVEAERMQVIYNDWVTKLHPETEAEEALVSTAAIEYVRYVRCVRADEARLRPAAKAAVRAWKEQKQKAVRKLAQGLHDHPSRVVAELEESGFGIDWMARHWSRLLAMLDAGQCPTGIDFDRCTNLMGLPALAERTPGSELATFWADVYAAFPLLKYPPDPTPARPDRAALGRLKSFIAAKIGRLEAIRPIAWESSEAEELESVEADATVDISQEGQLRHRYRRDAQRDYQRSLAQLDKLRSERSKTHAREARLMAEVPLSHRPAYVPPPKPSPTDSPNEPAPTATSATDTRLNPQPFNVLRDPPSVPSGDPGRRTDGRTESARAEPEVPDSGPRGNPGKKVGSTPVSRADRDTGPDPTASSPLAEGPMAPRNPSAGAPADSPNGPPATSGFTTRRDPNSHVSNELRNGPSGPSRDPDRRTDGRTVDPSHPDPAAVAATDRPGPSPAPRGGPPDPR